VDIRRDIVLEDQRVKGRQTNTVLGEKWCWRTRDKRGLAHIRREMVLQNIRES
jgi:hypothetical protein